MTMKAIAKNQIPEKTTFVENPGNIHNSDSYRIVIKNSKTVNSVITKMLQLQVWIKGLHMFPNPITKNLALKTDSITESWALCHVIGGNVILLPVIDSSESEIKITTNNQQQIFKTLTTTKHTSRLTPVRLTTIIQFNNVLDKLYFKLVKPSHKTLIKTCLKRF